jgi:hypothetical protein
MRKNITPYATTNPAATPTRAFWSPGFWVGGPSCERSHPHCLQTVLAASIGSPQKLQVFFTLLPLTR